MKYLKLIFAVTMIAAVPSSLLAHQELSALPRWLTGAWVMEDGEKWADEYWTPARGGVMIGAARTGEGYKLTMWETTRIARNARGNLSFWAQPRGAPASEFPMVTLGDQDITFANAQHDYPQKIRYWRKGNQLNATISLIDGSKAYNFSYKLAGSPE